MQDQPTDRELIEVVIQFLEEEIQPLVNHDPRMRFRTLIATNVLRIVNRELAESEPLLRAEWHRLQLLTGRDGAENEIPAHPERLKQEIREMNRALCERLRAGEVGSKGQGEWSPGLMEHLEATVKEKLQIANPRFLVRSAV